MKLQIKTVEAFARRPGAFARLNLPRGRAPIECADP